jgi:hypothetical protein
VKDNYAFFETYTHYFGYLTKLCLRGIVEDLIVSFEQLKIHTKGMTDSFFKEYFLSGLKEEI